ncbi:MAG: aminotransferase class IV [Alphaproteobacteria bacterium]
MTQVLKGQQDNFMWLDGEFVPWKSAQVPMAWQGLQSCGGVFEQERAYDGRVFKQTEHHERLLKSAHLLDMRPDITVAELNTVVQALLIKNNLQNACVRPFIWCESDEPETTRKVHKTHIAIKAWEWPSSEQKRLIQEGVSLCWGEWERPHPATFPVHAKTVGLYITGNLCKNRAREKGFDEALMKDYRGFVAECTGAHIFFVIRGEIHTPNPLCFLDGITRQTVIELALRRGFKVRVRDIAPEELEEAEEIFITGTTVEVLPVGRVEQARYPLGFVTELLRADYAAVVRAK